MSHSLFVWVEKKTQKRGYVVLTWALFYRALQAFCDLSMAKHGLFDLEKHFAFYGAYHSNPINIILHMLFVWPIFFTALIIFYFTPSLFNLRLSLFENNLILLLNFGFFFPLIYSLFYVCLDAKSGCLAALLCFICWVSSSFLANKLGFSLAWKVISVSLQFV